MPEPRARHPLAGYPLPAWGALVAAAAIAIGILIAGVGPHLTLPAWLDFTGSAVTTLIPFPVMFGIGVWFPRWAGVAIALCLVVPGEAFGGFNPFIVVLVVGPWLVGVMIRERRRLAEQLEETGRQLRAEQQLLAEESVRYERSRVARELHDIVAHCVSVMVVQAYAGERLTIRDPASAATAFDHIAEAAEQARVEIGHLVGLLAPDPAVSPPRLATGVAELVAGAVATGLAVNLMVRGSTEHLPEATSQVAYRAIQECITNALKHAPGAPVEVLVDSGREALTIEVINATLPPSERALPLAAAGGGHGLGGMRHRAASLGGSCVAGQRPDGAWQVKVTLPI